MKPPPIVDHTEGATAPAVYASLVGETAEAVAARWDAGTSFPELKERFMTPISRGKWALGATASIASPSLAFRSGHGGLITASWKLWASSCTAALAVPVSWQAFAPGIA